VNAEPVDKTSGPVELKMRNFVIFAVLALAGCKPEPQNLPSFRENRQTNVEESKEKFDGKSDDAARKIIVKAVEAHGGVAKIMRLQIARVRYKSQVRLGKKIDIDVELIFQMPNQSKKSRAVQTMGKILT
jgi:hypothetical protein